jgi:hypothetical protein
MSTWGQFKKEERFNDYLRAEGEGLLLQELRTFFGTNFDRIHIRSSAFGLPDHSFFSEEHGRLLLIESAEILNKDHLAKDVLYLFDDTPGFNVKTKILFWILLSRPSIEIVKKINVIYEKMLIGTNQAQFHISTVTTFGNSSLRLNLEASFGDRIVPVSGQTFLSHCVGTETYFSVKDISNILGLPYTSTFNTLRRWHTDSTGNKISSTALKEMIAKIEQRATADTGIDFSGKFVPINARADDMLFPAELNRVLGRKGNAVRIDIKPRWITVCGPANRGYRYLYDKNDILSFIKYLGIHL